MLNCLTNIFEIILIFSYFLLQYVNTLNQFIIIIIIQMILTIYEKAIVLLIVGLIINIIIDVGMDFFKVVDWSIACQDVWIVLCIIWCLNRRYWMKPLPIFSVDWGLTVLKKKIVCVLHDFHVFVVSENFYHSGYLVQHFIVRATILYFAFNVFELLFQLHTAQSFALNLLMINMFLILLLLLTSTV